MDTFDRTLSASNYAELKLVYNDEEKKLNENEYKLRILQKLEISDFPSDLPESSKKNIEKALLAIKLRDHIDIGGGHKLLGLDDYDVTKITLSYTEKKMIREQVEHLLGLEIKKNAHIQQKWEELKSELDKTEEKFFELQIENKAKAEKLLELKTEEHELLKEVAEMVAGPTQKNQVKNLLDQAKITQLQMSTLAQVIKESEENRTRYAKKAISDVTSNIDRLLEEKKTAKK